MLIKTMFSKLIEKKKSKNNKALSDFTLVPQNAGSGNLAVGTWQRQEKDHKEERADWSLKVGKNKTDHNMKEL